MRAQVTNRRTGVKDIAPIIRQAFILAAKRLEAKGKPLSDIMERQLEKDPLATLRALGPYVPKNVNIDADITSRTEADGLPETARLVTGLAAAGSTEDMPDTLPH